MNDYATLPLEAHNNRSVFLENAWNIGRAYRNQALELISKCQLLSRIAPPMLAYEDDELRRKLRVCDLALRSAADSGMKVTDEANARFKEATQMLSSHPERRDLPPTIYSRMEMAQQRDSVESDWPYGKSEDEWGQTMTINFVILQSPLISPHGSEAITVSQELSANPSFPEILWNFSRYNDRARITLEQNPHFYLRCPADEGAYTPTFRRHPLQDPRGALENNATIYVLFDRPGRVFLTTGHNPRIFGNVWSLNGSLIFRDRSGVLEGERLVISSSIQHNLWYCGEPVVPQDSISHPRFNHSRLRPIVTTPSADRSAEGTFEDWIVLSCPGSYCVDIQIYGSRGPTGSLGPPPPPPISERPGYRVHYTTVNTLDDDTLLGIFNFYRLDDENSWNVRLGWHKLSHVCQRWRHLIYESAFHLGMYIQCTNGTPVVDTLDHLPPLPLFVSYRDTTANLRGKDELGIHHALRSRDRVRSIDLDLSPSILHKSLMLMGESFPILEYLSLSLLTDEITTLKLPKTFLAPNLRHLALLGIGLPKRLRLLSSTISLVTLVLENIGASNYFHPRLIVARLQSLPQLEELSIGFSIPIPRPSTERELLSKQGTHVTLPNLEHLTFRGVSAYLECLIAQIRTPLLKQLNISYSIKSRLHCHSCPTSPISQKGSSSPLPTWFDRHFLLRVMCKDLDWQIDCAAQICSALMPALSGAERLRLEFHEGMMPIVWLNGEIDGTTWHELLRSFIEVEELHICDALTGELSRALELDEIGSDPGFLPVLRRLETEYTGPYTAGLFTSFIGARSAMGRPVHLSSPVLPYGTPTPSDSPVIPSPPSFEDFPFVPPEFQFRGSPSPFPLPPRVYQSPIPLSPTPSSLPLHPSALRAHSV